MIIYCSNIFKFKECSLFKFILKILMYVLLKYVDIINFVFMYLCSDMCEIVLFIEFDLYLIFCDGILLYIFYVG